MAAGGQEPFRVLFVITTSDFGGTESFLLRLLQGLDRQRFAPQVVSLCPSGRIGQAIADLGIPVRSLAMASQVRPDQLLTGAWRLARLIRREKIQLVQSLLYRANVLCALATRLPGAPPLVTGQRSLIPKGRQRDAWAQRWTRSWADRVVAVSQAVRDELLATEAIDPARVVVIQNGIDLERFQVDPSTEADQRAAMRAAWGIPPQDLVVGAVGRLHGPKGIHHLIEAFALAHARCGASSADSGSSGLGLQLVLAGDGPDLAKLREQAAASPAAQRIHFLGYQADPRPLYPAFDLYVLPSLAEGSPNALLEAMGCRRACIASRVGGVPEALDDGHQGLLVPPGDAEKLAEAILALAADPARRQELAAAARAKVERDFDARGMVARHEALYTDLLATRLPRVG